MVVMPLTMIVNKYILVLFKFYNFIKYINIWNPLFNYLQKTKIINGAKNMSSFCASIELYLYTVF